ncbi:hypothetical protein ABPG74_021874 [Tetrahymena malaccensis]
MDVKIAIEEINIFSSSLLGTISPYPIVPTVTIEKYIDEIYQEIIELFTRLLATTHDGYPKGLTQSEEQAIVSISR